MTSKPKAEALGPWAFLCFMLGLAIIVWRPVDAPASYWFAGVAGMVGGLVLAVVAYWDRGLFEIVDRPTAADRFTAERDALRSKR